MENNSRSKTGGRGIGLNFGPIRIGSQGQKGTTENTTIDTRSRYVTDTYLQNAVEQVVDNLQIYAYVESERDVDRSIERLLEFLKDRTKPIDARLDQTESGFWKLTGAGIDRSLNQSEVKVIMSAKPILDSSMSTKTTRDATIGEDKASSTDEFLGTQKYHNDILWTRDGNDWVPTSIKLNSISFVDLENQQSAKETLVIARPRVNRIEHEIMLIKQGSEKWSTLAGDLQILRERLQKSESRKIACEIVSATANTAAYQNGTATVSVPENRWMSGGGCLISTVHRKLVESYPSDIRTWRCVDRDHSYPAGGSITAYAIACQF